MKIAIVGNQARAMSNFWTVLIRELKKDGHEVVCLVPSPLPGEDISWEAALLSLGVRLRRYPLDRKGLNPTKDLKTLLFLRRMLRLEKPDVLFASTIKPVIYASLAAALARYPKKKNRHVMITGLGYTFEANTALKRWLMRVVCLLYRTGLSCVQSVFFQNQDDRQVFEQNHILPSGIQVNMCNGTGVDVNHFQLAPLAKGIPEFLFVGRLLEAKGLRDLHDAAVMVKSKYPDVRICILGPEEKGPGAVPLDEVLSWQREGSIDYLGETRDVRPYLEKAGVVVLPSWREGVPCSLMEAMSMGRALLAADAPGSREVVEDGKNGFLVPVGDARALADAMERFIAEPSLVAEMGKQGRSEAEKTFDAVVVARKIMQDMGIA